MPARAQVKRDSFGHYFSQQKEQNEVTWTPTPLEALLDVDQVIEAWRLRGITIHRACPFRCCLGWLAQCMSLQGASQRQIWWSGQHACGNSFAEGA